jgi:hypothetical protein
VYAYSKFETSCQPFFQIDYRKKMKKIIITHSFFLKKKKEKKKKEPVGHGHPGQGVELQPLL